MICFIVFTRSTHTNAYVISGSHQHPSNVQSVLSALLHRDLAPCDKESHHDELEFLKTTFRENVYSIKLIRCALNPAFRTSKPKGKPTSVAVHPYVQTTSVRLSRVLAKHIKPLNAELNPIRHLLALVGARHIVHVGRVRVKCVSLRPRKISSFIRVLLDTSSRLDVSSSTHSSTTYQIWKYSL